MPGLLSAFIGFVFRSVIVKFVLYFAMFFVVTEFISVLLPLFPVSTSLTLALTNLTPGIWFFLDLFKFDLGVSMSLAAFVTRFIVRRVPIIG